MEYCGAGSVSDIMKLRRKTLTEEEMSVIVRDTLMGLSYLHSMKKMYVVYEVKLLLLFAFTVIGTSKRGTSFLTWMVAQSLLTLGLLVNSQTL